MDMTFSEAYQKYTGNSKVPDGYEVQVNYVPIKPEQFHSLEVHDGDVVRLAKPYEVPIQFIIGEDEDGI